MNQPKDKIFDKKKWEKPEIKVLDFNKTEGGGAIDTFEETDYAHPDSSS
jgi:hypothetical protein